MACPSSRSESPCAERPCLLVRMGAAVGSIASNPSRLGGWRGDDAAGDAVAGVAGGVGLHVVCLLVDHDGGSAVGDDADGGGGVEGEVVDLEGGLADVSLADHDVLGEVAGVVAHGILKAVLLVLRVEVAACGLEVGGIAERLGVDMDGVFADGKVLEIDLDDEFALVLLEGGGAGVFAGAGLDGNDDFILWLGEDGDREKANRECSESVTHRAYLQSASTREDTGVFLRVVWRSGICM